ncbi:MAG TPA: MerR family transcriptional regulator [Acidimicrobiia bacterium]|jgi:DNA-binding transcriptional MerR regulator
MSDDHLAIGDVLQELRSEFDDITISKIRFLESQGLIAPERTPSGYRKFAPEDVERLRWILAQQRDHFLPLKVIKDRLDELDESQLSLDDLDEVRRPAKKAAVEKFFEAARSGGGAADFESAAPDGASVLGDATGVSMTRAELASAAGLSDGQLAELESYGLVEPIDANAERPLFDEGALVVAQAAGKFMQFGIEPRHLRMYKSFTERELNLFDQVVQPMRRPNRPEAGERADATVDELVQLGQRLRAGLMHSAGTHRG